MEGGFSPWDNICVGYSAGVERLTDGWSQPPPPGTGLFSGMEWVSETPKPWGLGGQFGKFPEDAYHP